MLALFAACGDSSDNYSVPITSSQTNSGAESGEAESVSDVFEKASENEEETDSVAENKNTDSSGKSSAGESKTSTAGQNTSAEVEAQSTEEIDPEEYVVSAEEIESALTGYEQEISGSWTARCILDANGEEVDGSVIYGQDYKTYGGVMTFSEDGTFSVRMGVSNDNESTKGTYTYTGTTSITLLYYNDSTTECVRCTLNGEDAIEMPLELFGDSYKVYFTR